MRCSEFDDRLQRLLDQRAWPGADDELQQHADCCPPCRESLALQLRVLQVFRADPSRSPARRFSLSAVWPAAAVALIAAAVCFRPSVRHGVDQQPPILAAVAPTQWELAEWIDWLEAVRDVELPAPADRGAQAAWLQPVRGGFVPLANCFASTFNVLKQTWPSPAEGAVGDGNRPAG